MPSTTASQPVVLTDWNCTHADCSKQCSKVYELKRHIEAPQGHRIRLRRMKGGGNKGGKGHKGSSAHLTVTAHDHTDLPTGRFYIDMTAPRYRNMVRDNQLACSTPHGCLQVAATLGYAVFDGDVWYGPPIAIELALNTGLHFGSSSVAVSDSSGYEYLGATRTEERAAAPLRGAPSVYQMQGQANTTSILGGSSFNFVAQSASPSSITTSWSHPTSGNDKVTHSIPQSELLAKTVESGESSSYPALNSKRNITDSDTSQIKRMAPRYNHVVASDRPEQNEMTVNPANLCRDTSPNAANATVAGAMELTAGGLRETSSFEDTPEVDFDPNTDPQGLPFNTEGFSPIASTASTRAPSTSWSPSDDTAINSPGPVNRTALSSATSNDSWEDAFMSSLSGNVSSDFLDHHPDTEGEVAEQSGASVDDTWEYWLNWE